MSGGAGPVFDNAALAEADLPTLRSVAFEPVAGAFRGYTVLSTLAVWTPILLAAAAFAWLREVPERLAEIVLAALAVLALLVGIHRWIDAGLRGWALRTHDVIARRGVFWRSVTALPVARIQHVETTSGPLERLCGLARLKLYTAGGATADLVVVGLPAALADRLREHLVEQIRSRDAGEAGAHDVDEGNADAADP